MTQVECIGNLLSGTLKLWSHKTCFIQVVPVTGLTVLLVMSEICPHCGAFLSWEIVGWEIVDWIQTHTASLVNVSVFINGH